MTVTYRCRWDRELQKLVDVPLDEAPRQSRPAGPYIQSDYPAYRSPLGDGWIDGRAAKREHHKRTGTRAIDPSEQKPVYRNPEFVKKRPGLKLGGDPLVGGRLPTTVDANWKDHG